MSITTIQCEFKKRKPGFDSKFFKIEKKIQSSLPNSNPLGLKKLLQLREISTYLGSKTIKERGTWIDLGLRRLFKLCRFDLGRVDCITKMISVHERLIILLSLGTLFIIFGHGWLHSNHFCKTCQNCFCPSWRCMCAAWWHLQDLSQHGNNSCICTALCTTTQNLDEDCFWHALQKLLLSSRP